MPESISDNSSVQPGLFNIAPAQNINRALMSNEAKDICDQAQGFIITTHPIHDPVIRVGLHFYTGPSTYEFLLSSINPEANNAVFHIYFFENFLMKFIPVFPVLHSVMNPENMNERYACDVTMTSVIKKITGGNFSSQASAILLEAYAIELLTLSLERMGCSKTAFQLSKYDIEILHAAKKILVSDFENIPTIMQLARKVGTNDFKLKKGFKQLFGSSIFAYVQDVRLNKAKALLEETELPVTDIAYMTGYEHAKNFAAAFKRKFGCGVREVRKNKM